MMSVIMLSVIILSVVIVIVLNVVAPFFKPSLGKRIDPGVCPIKNLFIKLDHFNLMEKILTIGKRSSLKHLSKFTPLFIFMIDF
jgi:hypothetical protein